MEIIDVLHRFLSNYFQNNLSNSTLITFYLTKYVHSKGQTSNICTSSGYYYLEVLEAILPDQLLSQTVSH